MDRWGAKPQEVNEVEWAKRGWECVGKERVRCVSCRAEVVVQVEVEGGAGGDDDGDVTLEDVEGSLNVGKCSIWMDLCRRSKLMCDSISQ